MVSMTSCRKTFLLHENYIVSRHLQNYLHQMQIQINFQLKSVLHNKTLFPSEGVLIMIKNLRKQRKNTENCRKKGVVGTSNCGFCSNYCTICYTLSDKLRYAGYPLWLNTNQQYRWLKKKKTLLIEANGSFLHASQILHAMHMNICHRQPSSRSTRITFIGIK